MSAPRSRPVKGSRRVGRSLVALLALSLAGVARAQAVHDGELAAALQGGREADVERLASARLAGDAGDVEAWSALVRLARTTTDTARHTALRQRVDACAAQPSAPAACTFGSSALLLQDTSAMALALKASRIREGLLRALAVDPSMFAARATLVQYYLDAGRFSGGSVDKAREAADAAAASWPQQARYLSALVARHEGRIDEAATLLSQVQPGDDRELADALAARWDELATWWMSHKAPGRAREVYERVAREHPTDPAPRLDIVRAAMAQQDYDAAIAQLDALQRFPDRQSLALDYRLGVAWQAKGDAGRARAAFLRFLAAPAGRDPVQLEDARSRLADLR